jgi:hypothetical protein
MWRATLGVLMLASVAGCAGAPSQSFEPRFAEATSTSQHCLVSGSHIRTHQGNCFSTGRSHYWAKYRGTSTADLLRRLDPAVTIRTW